MAQVTYPGVYVEEVSSGVRPITAASTSVAAFIGIAERGPVHDALKVFNLSEYQRRYGGFIRHSYLSHAVYQFFNNGGTQCYVIRVVGADAATATTALSDRAPSDPKTSLTVVAHNPGAWGNNLIIRIGEGINDSGNTFSMVVLWQGEPVPLETYSDLSMDPNAANFVETVTASSTYIRVTVNDNNDSSDTASGFSRGARESPTLENAGPKTRFRINVNHVGFQEVDLQAAVSSDAGGVPNLDTTDNVRAAIQKVVRELGAAFNGFECVVEYLRLVLRSGATGATSSVQVLPAIDSTQDASGLLGLGPLKGGIESLGLAVTRPRLSAGETLQGGAEGEAITTDQPYVNAFSALDDKEDVSLLAVPGIGSTAVVGAGMNYCANRPLSDCFFIGDMSQDDDTIEEAKAFRDDITPKNSYGAVYVPWVRMLDPTGQSAEPLVVPPSGFVAGQYARTDARQGVWKAPAGTSAALGGALGLSTSFTDVQQGNLNPIDVNVIRQFTGSGIVLWGARTINADAEWRYIPVRRTAIFLRVSIYRGIQWAVFEPNGEDLWSSLRLNIGSFMMTLFRQGAFQGTTPRDAFFVKCDSETTTQDHINAGIVNVLVGFAPLKPAEFVVVQISQQVGQVG